MAAYKHNLYTPWKEDSKSRCVGHGELKLAVELGEDYELGGQNNTVIITKNRKYN